MSAIAKRIWSCFAITALVVAGLGNPAGAGAQPSEPLPSTGESVDQPAEPDATEIEAKEMRVIRGRSGASPGLDALLKLPTGYVGERAPSVAGASESEWRRRFRKTRETLTEARRTLEKTKRELDSVANEGGGTQWAVAAPSGAGGGAGPPNSTSPLSFKLRGALKRNRLDLDTAEKEMRDLNIEADLAGVPKSWRGDTDADGETPSEVGQLLD